MTLRAQMAGAALVLMSLTACASDDARTPEVYPGEAPVPPYQISDANAGAVPYADDQYFQAMGGYDGVRAVVEEMTRRTLSNPDVKDIFFATDGVRFVRTVTEQFCYLLGGPCAYTGRAMGPVHKDHGITIEEFNAVAAELDAAMVHLQVPGDARAALMAKLGPMADVIVTRVDRPLTFPSQ